MRYLDHLRTTHGITDSRITADLTVRDGRLWFRDLDLAALSYEHGTPLEIAYLPVIGDRVRAMVDAFAAARAATGYGGGFVYAYASKANTAAEVVGAALAAGAHYECSSAFDLDIVRLLRRAGRLPSERLVLCNGFKTPAYARKILRLRGEGLTGIVPILDDPRELRLFGGARHPLLLGIRQRIGLEVTDHAGLERVESRFGMSFTAAEALAAEIERRPRLRFALYHAMLGSQVEDVDAFLRALRVAAGCWARLRRRHEGLRYLDIGGGMPVPYRLGFRFDYGEAARRALAVVREECAVLGVPEPDIVGEFGRYTAAEHGFHIFRVIGEKPSGRAGVAWYLIDGSLMVALPDIWALGQDFIVLPLTGYERECQSVWLGGLTCDVDDEYREGAEGGGHLTLPCLDPAEPLDLCFFATGAYQEMLSGVRGAHHCLIPEAKELIIDHDAEGTLRIDVVARQSSAQVLRALGYR